jgi:hypothetical protein
VIRWMRAFCKGRHAAVVGERAVSGLAAWPPETVISPGDSVLNKAIEAAWRDIRFSTQRKEEPYQTTMAYDGTDNPLPSRGCENCLWWERCPRFHFDGRVCHRFRMRRT